MATLLKVTPRSAVILTKGKKIKVYYVIHSKFMNDFNRYPTAYECEGEPTGELLLLRTYEYDGKKISNTYVDEKGCLFIRKFNRNGELSDVKYVPRYDAALFSIENGGCSTTKY